MKIEPCVKTYIKYLALLIMVMFFASCHSTVKRLPKVFVVKDSIQTPVLPAKQKGYTWVALDTIVGKDTIKMVVYGDTIIKCSLNQLSDTIYNRKFIITALWDKKDIDTAYLIPNIAKLILVPGSKKPRPFILNDTLLIVALSDWHGRGFLYLLNRTPHSLAFAKTDEKNPLGAGGYYIYADIKKNNVIDYGHRVHASGDDGDGDIYAPYEIKRFMIKNKRFIYTDCDTSFFKQFLKLDMEKLSDVRTFYNIIAHQENWKRDKYADPYNIPVDTNE